MKKLSADDADIKQQVANRFEPVLNALKNRQLHNELLEFSNLVYPAKHSLFDYLPDDGTIYFDDLKRIKQFAKQMTHEDAGWFKDKVDNQQLTDVPDLSNDVSAIIKKDPHPQI